MYRNSGSWFDKLTMREMGGCKPIISRSEFDSLTSSLSLMVSLSNRGLDGGLPKLAEG
ncbi:hypothetical protein FHW16_000697 [Phyllobacterium myrsinacearum]|uniref:Uncharacterized protein n=1 Tax=Phyllobacterium myrsinacearum TaxID=28101 RepID=A0A839EFF0_9HYPH|nr:hypothetical protein [Phyllobacterium myrsinacearum]